MLLQLVSVEVGHDSRRRFDGFRYLLESSSDLRQWRPAGELLPHAPFILLPEDPPPNLPSPRFYRVRIVPGTP